MKSVTPTIMIAIAGIALFFVSAASAQMIPERPNGTPSDSPFDNSRDPRPRGPSWNLDPRDPVMNTPSERQIGENWRYNGFTTPRTVMGSNGTEVYIPPHAIGGGPIDGLVGRGPPPNVSDSAEVNGYLREHGYVDNLGRFHPGSSVPYRGHDEAAGDNDERHEGVGDNDSDEDVGGNVDRHEDVGDDNERHEGASNNDSDEGTGDNASDEGAGDNESDGE